MDEKSGRRVCELIAGVLCADDEMAPLERVFLKRVMVRCGIETDTALMPIYAGDVAAELARLPAHLREEMLDLVIAAAVADGKVVPAERQLIDLVAAEMQVGDADVDERIRYALEADDA